VIVSWRFRIARATEVHDASSAASRSFDAGAWPIASSCSDDLASALYCSRCFA
jgi:hypothetical protein